MAFVVISSLISINEEAKYENIKRKWLRDSSNPLDLPEKNFIECFRLNKDAFQWILHKIGPHFTCTSIPLTIHLAATLRFFAEGSFQRSVGNDALIAMHRTTFSKILSKMVVILHQELCQHWIKLNSDASEILKSKNHFFDKHGIPGVVGCIDGTHIQIVKPGIQDHLYFNRKGYYSINAMIICDYNMNVMAVDATRPGSSHDSFVWILSVPKDFYRSRYETGERGSWLLADSGYALEPYVLTPYRNPSVGSAQHKFNKAHVSGRNIIERTIGVVKSRFRCLSRAMWYKPPKVVKIINICCALHNMCNFYKIEQRLILHNPPAQDPDTEEVDVDNTTNNEANRTRDSIAQSL